MRDRWPEMLRDKSDFGLTVSVAAVSAKFGQVQLFNPVASGQLLLVDVLQVFSNTAASTVVVQDHTAVLATLVGNGANRFLGGSVSVAEIRQEANAALLGSQIFSFAVPGAREVGCIVRAFVVPAGRGLIIGSATANQHINAGFFWREVSG